MGVRRLHMLWAWNRAGMGWPWAGHVMGRLPLPSNCLNLSKQMCNNFHTQFYYIS